MTNWKAVWLTIGAVVVLAIIAGSGSESSESSKAKADKAFEVSAEELADSRPDLIARYCDAREKIVASGGTEEMAEGAFKVGYTGDVPGAPNPDDLYDAVVEKC